MFFYKKLTITSALRFRIALTFIYFVKLFRTTTKSILTNIFSINI